MFGQRIMFAYERIMIISCVCRSHYGDDYTLSYSLENYECVMGNNTKKKQKSLWLSNMFTHVIDVL